MKIFSNRFSLNAPAERQYYVSPNSIYAFGVKFEKDGEDVSGYQLSVFLNGTALTPMEATVDGYTLFQRTSGSEPAVSRFDVVYTKDSVIQHFELTETVTNSTVFDIGQEGGAFELPIASDSVLGGIKVGENLTIAADGTLSADEETDPVFTEWKDNLQTAVLSGTYTDDTTFNLKVYIAD